MSSLPCQSTQQETGQHTGSVDSKQPKVLVVGDWIFDEHWVTGTHRSVTSSRTGLQHLRALHAHDNALYGFCGAAETASILCRARVANHLAFQVFGAGVWDDQDTNALWTALHLPLPAGHSPDQSCSSYQSPYRITRDFRPHLSEEPRLLNIGRIIEESPKNKEKNIRCGTMRVVRLYRYTGSELELLSRIDWEPQIPGGRTAWIPSDHEDRETDEVTNGLLDILVNRLREFAEKCGGIDAIVLHDMHKGGVSRGLVNCLQKALGSGKKWFVLTKAWRPAQRHVGAREEPDWLTNLENEGVRLLLIPQPAAKRLVHDGDMSSWITQQGIPSREALAVIDDLSKRFEKASIVVLPDSFTLLGRDRLGLCIVQTDKREPDTQYSDDESVGAGASLTSVLFPSLIAQMLRHDVELKEMLPPALIFTNTRTKEEVARIKHPERRSPELPDHPLELTELLPEQDACKQLSLQSRFNKPVPVGDWHDIQSDWEKAFKECGILGSRGKAPIESNGQLRIEPWRAMTDVNGYVCSVPSKRDAIRQVLRQVSAFIDNPQQHRSLMMVAPPGAGKTHLVRQLAKSYDFSLLRFNLTQMLSKKDILDCFDAIATTRLQIKDKNLLVFIDEINALLDSQHVYDAFLAPIEEGVYVRGGKTFHIDPCLWLFAGTESPRKHHDKSGKESDFISRLSIRPVRFKPETGEEIDLSTERAYLGVCLLRDNFPDVRRISQKVLMAFEFLRPDIENREIEKFVKSFPGIQYAQVTSSNVPLDRFQKLTHQHISHPHHWEKWNDARKTPEGPMVEIIDHAPTYGELRVP